MPVDQVVDRAEIPELGDPAPASLEARSVAAVLLGQLEPGPLELMFVRRRLCLDLPQTNHVRQGSAERGDDPVDRGAKVPEATRKRLADERAALEIAL